MISISKKIDVLICRVYESRKPIHINPHGSITISQDCNTPKEDFRMCFYEDGLLVFEYNLIDNIENYTRNTVLGKGSAPFYMEYVYKTLRGRASIGLYKQRNLIGRIQSIQGVDVTHLTSKYYIKISEEISKINKNKE